MATKEATILSAFEAESIIDNFKKFKLSEVGTTKWLDQHENIERLTIQAHRNLNNQCDEFISEAVISLQKVEFFIHDLILTQTWISKVYPNFKAELVSKNSIVAYFLLYHEATIINMLQVVFMNSGACKEAGDSVLDILEYLVARIAQTVSSKVPIKSKVDLESMMKISDEERFQNSIDEMQFVISMNCLALFRSITEAVNDLPMAALNLILQEYDMPCSLIHILESSPWIRKIEGGGIERFDGNKWVSIHQDDIMTISKVEAQIWLALMNLLLESVCRKKYNYNKKNQEIVLRLKDYLLPEVVDQIPPLVDLQRYLEELTMMDPPDHGSLSSGIKPISEIKTEILNIDLQQIIQQQKEFFLNMNQHQKLGLSERLSKIYDVDAVEDLLEDPKCGKCGNPATQRCSLCKTEWYCGRPCQVQAWKSHKQICDLIRSQ